SWNSELHKSPNSARADKRGAVDRGCGSGHCVRRDGGDGVGRRRDLDEHRNRRSARPAADGRSDESCGARWKVGFSCRSNPEEALCIGFESGGWAFPLSVVSIVGEACFKFYFPTWRRSKKSRDVVIATLSRSEPQRCRMQ